ncbi:hypothetical protein C9E81_15710 [Paracoccus alkanivorans]|uniref:Uncharacterized protein n=1 Tax=Paracoccus alkanivorans TaxID=2116655 RepID=A0A3M0M7H0_9RHOB|nr:hypothetical protein C9E81_15710 [Paracoccus alkanivorans]
MMHHRPIDHIPEPAVGERRMWCAVLGAVIEDYRKEYAAAVRRQKKGELKGPTPEMIIADVRRYFASRDAREVCLNAGFDELQVEMVLKRVLGVDAETMPVAGRWNGGRRS